MYIRDNSTGVSHFVSRMIRDWRVTLGRLQVPENFVFVGERIWGPFYWACSPDGQYVGIDEETECRGETMCSKMVLVRNVTFFLEISFSEYDSGKFFTRTMVT